MSKQADLLAGVKCDKPLRIIPSCCASQHPTTSERERCGGSNRSEPTVLTATTCCDLPASYNDGRPSSQPGVPPSIISDDLEKGKPSTEHVVLSVPGMTCVGCEGKLNQALRALSTVSNIQTSLVLSRAEFDLDAATRTADDVVRHVQKTTGFACSIIKTRGHYIEVVVEGDPSELVATGFTPGIIDAVLLEKAVAQISYDPSIIGARDLVERGFRRPLKLAPPRPYHGLAAAKKDVRYKLLMTILSASLTIPVLVLAWAPLPQHPIAYGAISLALATIVQCVVAGPFYPSALRALLFTHVLEMDLLIVLSTTTAYVFSCCSFGYLIAGRPLAIGDFFETSTLLVTLIMLGRLVSAVARHQAVESISIRALQTDTALLIDTDKGTERQIDSRLLQFGDTFKVLPESRVPTDGMIVAGSTEVDESMVTGEAAPVWKTVGSTVIAGSLNGSGTVTVRLTQLPGENTISEMARMVDKARFSRPRAQGLADRTAGDFVLVVVALSFITFTTWTAVKIAILRTPAGTAVVDALTYAISVLIISCPCAIGLAVPMVVAIASGVAAKKGIIFKSGETIEIARKTSHVVFDKTGTLTEGRLSVRGEQYLSPSDERTMSLILGLTREIRHPVAMAVTTHLRSLGVQPSPIEDIRSVPGCGIQGRWHGSTMRVGNSRWLSVETSPVVRSFLVQGLTVFCVCRDSTLLAVYGLSDTIRPEARSVINSLKSCNIDVSLVSGDDTGAVLSVAMQVGIPLSNVRSKCTPANKQAYIRAILDSATAQSHKDEKRSRKRTVFPTQFVRTKPQRPTVIFVGDGANDAPALATATIGIHMPSNRMEPAKTGTDSNTDIHSPSIVVNSIAQSAADVSLSRPSLLPVPMLLKLSRATYRRIVFNFVWAFAYNVVAILFASGAFGGRVRVPPRWAALGEIVSVVPVVLVGVGLRWAQI